MAPVASRVTRNDFLLRAQIDGYEFTVFPDSRAIIKGTDDEDVAKGLYAKYIGGYVFRTGLVNDDERRCASVHSAANHSTGRPACLPRVLEPSLPSRGASFFPLTESYLPRRVLACPAYRAGRTDPGLAA